MAAYVLILFQINEVPKGKWKEVRGRRVQNWGGIPHPKGMECLVLNIYFHFPRNGWRSTSRLVNEHWKPNGKT